ncbi:MAG: MFS transporter [Bryobacteraceae bacterium]|nr:MFS transporter [Bryobacteraceae bacterium]
MTHSLSWRWIAVSVFAISSTLNFLDRQILSALAPQLREEFGMTMAEYGLVISAFSLSYFIASPLAGLFIDRVGLRAGASVAVAAWSLAGIATGFTSTLRGLVACRAALGVAEAGGIPGAGKSYALYLKPEERAIGAGLGQAGLSLGVILAPLLAEYLSGRYGWRAAFVVVGAAGFLWIPLWLAVARKAPKIGEAPGIVSMPRGEMLRDRRYWALLAANVLLMSVYTLWMNWTTQFLVSTYGLTQADTNYGFAWVPPVFAAAGGLFGGWLTMRWSRGRDVVAVRLRVILLGSVLLLPIAALPWAPSPAAATAVISVSYFFCLVGSVNIYSLPLDLFGPARAAFAVSGLTAVYGLLQFGLSPVIGWVADHHGFGPVCLAVALLPLGGYGILRWALHR